ncbi:polymer-forming cytoskeletal protein [Antarcticibacterium sp. 1MA-6-2]|uniref:bactofilin family protein n=1 Tax=Antarcticibacterium sp. 1MA-6-2 TaxID=2908210 RepID=UPI001F3B1A9D|nr:polymer-forming cytoskeletal protein [Antarcticibacterium sp. 1MA-6-2]UJH90229.1 polymer-forming cytoskeletal protein [Antarcticibacterium sp. 1MA-6-2]
MFNNPTKPKSSSETSKEQNRISAGTVITYDIVAKGGFRVEGTIRGNVTTAGKVVISKGGLIDGTLICQNADFEGKFSGKLTVQETLTLRSAAVIEGEVTAGKLAIEPGATFNATCEMKGNLKTLPKDGSKQKERSA